MTKRKCKPEPVIIPTERQMDAALDKFEKSKLRHQIFQLGDRVAVKILPEMMVGTTEFAGAKGLPPISEGQIPDVAYEIKWFNDEAEARRWREIEIIRETVTAALRARA